MADRSIGPACPPAGLTDPMAGLAPPTGGLGAEGTGGLFPTFGASPGGFGVGLLTAAEALDSAAGFFHGVALPFDGPIPGNTETGFALTSAATDLATIGAAGLLAAEGVGTGRRAGGGGAGAAFAGTSSR